MKALTTALFLFLISFPVSALELPAHWCDQAEAPCSRPQLEIWDKFFHSGTALVGEKIPGLFTGSCYFKSRWHDSERESFGVIAMNRQADSIYFGGRFGEFYEKNPWADYTLEQALAEGMVRHEERFIPNLLPDYAWLNVSDSKEHFIYYWLRMNEAGDTLYLLGQADGQLWNFCELVRK